MSALSATMKLDVRLQARSKLYTIGIVVAIMLGLAGRFAFGPQHAGKVLAAFYLLALGGTTYIFGASLVLLEKSEGVLEALRTSPLTSTAYIASKAITLTVFALAESAVVYGIGFFGVAVNPLPLALGVVTLGVMYTFVGMGQVAGHDSVTSFLMPGALMVGGVMQLPVMHVLEVGPPLLWYAIPTQAPLLLMLGAFEPLENWQWAYAFGMSIVALGLSAWWARGRFARLVGLRDA